MVKKYIISNDFHILARVFQDQAKYFSTCSLISLIKKLKNLLQTTNTQNVCLDMQMYGNNLQMLK